MSMGARIAFICTPVFVMYAVAPRAAVARIEPQYDS